MFLKLFGLMFLKLLGLMMFLYVGCGYQKTENVFRGSETLIVLMNLMRIYENQNGINVGLGLTHL